MGGGRGSTGKGGGRSRSRKSGGRDRLEEVVVDSHGMAVLGSIDPAVAGRDTLEPVRELVARKPKAEEEVLRIHTVSLAGTLPSAAEVVDI